MVTTTRLLTLDEFLTMEADWDGIEVYDGVVEEDEGVGQRHGEVTFEFGRLLGNHIAERRLGRLTSSDTRFIVQTDPLRALAPDVAFIRADRLPPETQRDRPLELAPDLVVETILPSTSGPAIARKVAYWLAAGVPLVLVVNVRRRVVIAHVPGESPREYGERDILDGGDILPELRIRVADILA
jgi:Uma2 family endonuclease